MCQFFSFVGDGFGNYKYFDWEQRKERKFENCDSHTAILTYYEVPPNMQDKWSKYEYNPLTRQFVVDEGREGHDHESAEAWANALDFKRIAEPLVVKPIVHPFRLRKRKSTTGDIELLNQWASVWDSVGAGVRDSVWASVRASVWARVSGRVVDSVGISVWCRVKDSVVGSVGDSVWDRVWDSVSDRVVDSVSGRVWDSVRDSIRAYISSFVSIDYLHEFSSAVELWERGFVPSFDGTTWRLHSGARASVVYEWTPEPRTETK